MRIMKKLFKNSYIALAVLALGFSACTEQVEYTPAEVPATDQVYFSNANATKMDIAVDATSFDVYVSRIATDKAASVAVTVTADSLANEHFTFPATVDFAEGDTTAVYTVLINEGVNLEYEHYYSVSLAIAEEVATPYGNAEFAFQVGVPAPWSEWTKFGTGTYTLSIYWGGTHSELPIYYREYLLNDIDAQFYIPGIANSMDLTIDYNKQTGACQILPQYATTNSNYGQVTITDIPHYPFTNIDPKDYETYPCTYDAEKGLFTFNVAYIVCTLYDANTNGSFGNGVETFQLDGFYIPDYSLAMEFRGHYIDAAGTDNAVIAVTKGVDVASYLMTVVNADEDLNAVVSGMVAGTVPCDTLTEGGFYAYPMTESGDKAAVAVTFDAEGAVLDAYAKSFEFFLAGQENPWESLGYATYTEDCFTTFFKVENLEYKVEVLENKDQPGLYRVINPYGAAYPYNEEGDYDASKAYFFEIDATDPTAVYIPGIYDLGCDWGYGNFSISSLAYYYMAAKGATLEDVKAAGFCGILADKVITFPAESLLISMAGYKEGGLHTSNVNGAFKLDMSNMTETAEAPAARNAAARVNVELQGKNMGKVASFKKIDNSFLTLEKCEF